MEPLAMPEGGTGDLRARRAAIDARLDAATTAGERDALKGEIVSLFKQVEAQITDLSALKEDVKRLVDKWKSLQAVSAPTSATSTSPDATPKFEPERPKPMADHLGASTFIEKGWSLISLGEYEGAEKALTRALQLAPDDPQSESLLGWAQMLQEKYDDALMNFQKVLMREPANALARINVGYICLKKRIFGEAIEHLSKAIRLDNDRKATLYAHFYLGLVYLEREMYEDAETFFRKTLQLGPKLIEAYFELGRALWFDGQREAAMDTWRDGHRANKFNPWGKRCGEMLTHVEGGGSLSRSRATA
jgi:tetratricopeptide (TPR) repeat protein